MAEEPITNKCEERTLNNSDLLVEMECPVCTEYMHPPIRQCYAGHTFCHNCHPKLKNCPTCRMQISKTVRSFVLERIHAKMFFPCKFGGCDEIVPGNKILDHEAYCIHGGTACPLKELSKCEWIGRPREFVNHCIAKHASNMFCSNVQRLTCPGFAAGGDQQSQHTVTAYYILFHSYGEFFKCSWEVDYRSGYVRWCVFRLEVDEKLAADDYEFTIEIHHHGDSTRRVAFKAPCPVLRMGDDVEFDDVNFVASYLRMLKEYCNPNFDLSYTVKIMKRRPQNLFYN